MQVQSECAPPFVNVELWYRASLVNGLLHKDTHTHKSTNAHTHTRTQSLRERAREREGTRGRDVAVLQAGHRCVGCDPGGVVQLLHHQTVSPDRRGDPGVAGGFIARRRHDHKALNVTLLKRSDGTGGARCPTSC